MRKIFIVLTLIISVAQNSSACEAINEGAADNSDCVEVARSIYTYKAKTPKYGVTQAVYDSSWSQKPYANVTILVGSKMIFMSPGTRCLRPGVDRRECIASDAMALLESEGSDSAYERRIEDGAWVSAPTVGNFHRDYHLKQYGDYLVGYFLGNNGPGGIQPLFFISNIKTDKIDIAMPQ